MDTIYAKHSTASVVEWQLKIPNVYETCYPSRDSNGYPATGTGFEEMRLREEYKWIARKSSLKNASIVND